MVRVLIAGVLALLMTAGSRASDIGQEVAGLISQTSYRHILDDLLYTHTGMSRGRLGAQHDLARDNIVHELTSYGLDVELHPFVFSGTTYYDVIATQPGVLHPEQAYLIGAHFDSVNNPGADDDASGVAAVLEIARVLSQYDTAYTVKYCAWDIEENGLVGSTAYVADTRNQVLRGMIQIDMIAHDAGANREDVYASTRAQPLAQGLIAAFPLYGNGIGVQSNPFAGFSDHAPFDAAQYQAVCFVEDSYQSFGCYHQPCDSVDTPNYIDYPFATNFTRVIAGYLADSALAMRRDDCDGDTLSDAAEIAADPSLDCNGNGLLDACEPGLVQDCNANAVPDACEIANQTVADLDVNGIPDGCQNTLHVPADYATIQAAINAAEPGDTVHVSPGVYSGVGNRDLEFNGKVLLLRGEAGPTGCTINAAGGRGFNIRGGETHRTVIDGFTITGGTQSQGAGVMCVESSPTFRNCVLFGNSAATSGGAMQLQRRSNPLLVNCVVRDNTSALGGGIYCQLGSSPTIVNSVIAHNSGATGGGIACRDTAKPVLINCTIARNNATMRGGALYMAQTSGNDRSGPVFENCVVWGNTAVLAGQQFWVGPTTEITVRSSNVQGGQAGIIGGGGQVIEWSASIDADPLFVDASANDYRLGAGSPSIDAGDNSRVPPDEADIDGDGVTNEPLPRDLMGGERFVNDPAVNDTGIGTPPLVDMGAHEMQAAAACPGDVNGDGAVDLADLAVLLSHFGQTGNATRADGDLTGDGTVDLADLAQLLANFGSAC